jgi:hypothetical protein
MPNYRVGFVEKHTIQIRAMSRVKAKEECERQMERMKRDFESDITHKIVIEPYTELIPTKVGHKGEDYEL